MTIYELKVKELKTIEEVKKYYKIAADELITAEEDMLFDEDGFTSPTVENVRVLRQLVSALRSRVYELDEPALSDEVVDLYLDHTDHFTICEHDKSDPIGTVVFKQDDTLEETAGKLNCSMKKEYRGNSYSLRAIRLVGDSLSKQGITKVYVSSNDMEMPNDKEFGGMSLEGRGTYSTQPIHRQSSR